MRVMRSASERASVRACVRVGGGVCVCGLCVGLCVYECACTRARVCAFVSLSVYVTECIVYMFLAMTL